MTKKKYFKNILAIFILMSVLSCDRFNEKEDICKITPSSLQMRVGETTTIKIEVSEPVYAVGISNPEIVEILDSNENENIMIIKAIGVGEVSIYIELGSKKSECKITIRE